MEDEDYDPENELQDEEGEDDPYYGKVPLWLYEIDLSFKAIGVWTYLKVNHGRSSKSKIYPGQAKIAARCGISLRGVQSALAELQKKGAISVKRRGFGKTNQYKLMWKAPRKV